MQRLFSKLTILFFSGLLLTACSGRLADYQLPTKLENIQVDHTNTIRYRILTKEDFKSDNPRKIKRQYKHFAALSSIYIYFDENRLRQNTKIRKLGDQFVIVFTEPGYHALFDQSNSWINNNDKTLPKDYVLQHEQIHFSLMELEARRMNHKRKYDLIAVSESTQEKAIIKLVEIIKSDMEAIFELADKQNRKFDIQTSGRHLPKTQSRWMKEIWGDFNQILAN